MIYLDYAATTPLDSDVLEVMTPCLTTDFGNPSSQHSFGRKAANAVQDARDRMAKILGVKGDELYFTSGGTESGNTALKGICRQNSNKGRHIVLSAFEHPALLESASDLKKEGFEVTLVNPDERGIVSPQSIASALRPDTVFAGVMAANNEVGTIQPIEEIYAVCKEKGVFFFCDCVQIAGVIPFNRFPADGISFSAHKFYGPKGFGVLYMRGDRPFRRLISGGGQERSLRGGTTYAAGAVGCAYALEKAYSSMDEHNLKTAALRDEFVGRVLAEIPDTHLNGDREKRLPSNANISFDGCDGEQIVFALDLKGIAASTGSACSSGAVTLSHVLLSMGLEKERVKSAVRFTFGKYNTIEEVEEVVQALKEIVARIRAK